MKTFKKGMIIQAKELIGMDGFNICHMPTFTDNVNSVRWFSDKHTAVVINYNNNQTVIVDSNEEYIGLGNNNISYDNMAHNFLGNNWREKY